MAFSKAHANELWQADTLTGRYVQHCGTSVQSRLIAWASSLHHAPVRDGAAKGKVERFFRTVRDQGAPPGSRRKGLITRTPS